MRDIFKHHQRPGSFIRISAKRSQRYVEHERAAGAGSGVQLVNLTRLAQLPAIRTQYLVKRVGEVFRKQIFHPFPDGVVAGY